MNSVTEVPKPCAHGRPVYLLDPRVIVGGSGGSASDAGPVLGSAVLKRDLDFFVRLQIAEFPLVDVGEEKEVRTDALADRH